MICINIYNIHIYFHSFIVYIYLKINIFLQVLLLMYECWSSFGPLHFKSILGRYQRQKGKRFEDLLSFYLEHAARNRLKFNGIRMTDVSVYSSIHKPPVFLAANVWSWKELLIYLQYGAK